MIKPRALRHNHNHSAMAEVLEEVVIDCVALFYEGQRGEGGGELSQVQVPNEQAIESREAIW